MDKLRAVDEMEHHHLPRAAWDHTAEHMVGIAPHAQLARELGPPFDQPACLKGRRQLGHPHMARAGKLPADFGKCIVRPDDLAGRRQRDNGRQRRFGHCRADLAALDLNVLHQPLQALLSLALTAQGYHAQHHAKRNADQPIWHGIIQAAHGEQQEQHIKQHVARLERFL